MVKLHYKEIPSRDLDANLIERARGELRALAKGEPGQIFHATRLVQRKEYGGNLAKAHVFFSISPKVEAGMRKATDLLAEKECEFPVYVESKMYAGARECGQELHFAFVDGAGLSSKPVLLESQGHEISDTGISKFHKLVGEIRSGENARESLRELLFLMDTEIRLRKGVAPFLSLDGENLCAPGQEMDEGKAARVAGLISKNGIVGPNFVNIAFQAPREDVYFDFHGHPGYEGAWMIPPSGSDINRGMALIEEGNAELCLRAVAIRLGGEDFRLFIRPFFKGEGNVVAIFDEVLVRVAYLNESYNTTRERKVGGEAYLLLDWISRISPRLMEDKELVEKLKSFGELVGAKPDDQDRLIGLWNELLDKLEGALGVRVIPRANWREQLWGISGGALVESP